MGEEADFQLDQYYWGLSFEQDIEEEDGPVMPVTTKTCRCCGETNLVWGRAEGKWRLFTEDQKLHVCKVNPIKVSLVKTFDAKRVKRLDDKILALEEELASLKRRRDKIVGTDEDIPS